jgi:hypothetical protein
VKDLKNWKISKTSPHKMSDSTNAALVEWLNTFEIDRSCNSIDDIADGEILVKIMSQVKKNKNHSY